MREIQSSLSMAFDLGYAAADEDRFRSVRAWIIAENVLPTVGDGCWPVEAYRAFVRGVKANRQPCDNL